MRKVLYLGLLYLACFTVSAAPTGDSNNDIQPDEIEQELIRHHHSTRTDGDSEADDNTYSDEKGNLNDESSPVESIEDASEESDKQEPETYDEDDLYDITVGDVIRDVLLTLHDHPQIVKRLIENEKDKIATRLAEDAVDTVGADLSEFQGPAEQLKNEPKRVQKKDGKSGQVRTAATNRLVNGYHGDDAEFNGYMNHKRANEVLDEEFTPNDQQSSENSEQFDGYTNYVKLPKQEDQRYKALYGGRSQDESDNPAYRRHYVDSSDEDGVPNDQQVNYQLPFINPFAVFKNFKNSESRESLSMASEDSDSMAQKVKAEHTGSDETETESETKEEEESSSESSEEQLTWLLRRMEANKQKESSQKNM